MSEQGIRAGHPGSDARLLADAQLSRAVQVAAARLLRSDEPETLRPELSITADDRALWWSTGELTHSVVTGRPAYDHVFGVTFWQAVQASEAASARFQQAMTDSLHGLADDLLDRSPRRHAPAVHAVTGQHPDDGSPDTAVTAESRHAGHRR